jgi:hypothetical protein
VKEAASFGGLLRARSQDTLRRRGRPRWAAGTHAARRPVTLSPRVLVLGMALITVIAPQAQGAAPEPDPYVPTTATVVSPSPDPHPSAGDSRPTRARTTSPSPSPESPSPKIESPTSSAARQETTERAVTRPKPTPRTTQKPKAPAKTAETPAGDPRSEKGSIRAATTAAADTVSAARTTTDPMILGALALLTLAFSSAGLLLVLGRYERQGARA